MVPGWEKTGTPLCWREGASCPLIKMGFTQDLSCLQGCREHGQQWFWGLSGEPESPDCLLSACPSSTPRELGWVWDPGG